MPQWQMNTRSSYAENEEQQRSFKEVQSNSIGKVKAPQGIQEPHPLDEVAQTQTRAPEVDVRFKRGNKGHQGPHPGLIH